MLHKYQFCIRFHNVDVNSAASKAVLDCNRIFHQHGYRDYTFTVGDNSKKLPYYLSLLKQLVIFFFSVKRHSLIGIQYPLLSINNVFKYFIRIARLKGVKFFCVVHDLESLRTGGTDDLLIKKEVVNLNCYDSLIVHNDAMLSWLKNAGVKSTMFPLQLFDYLSADFNTVTNVDKPVVFAGNLTKSSFVYGLYEVPGFKFNLYGPGYDALKAGSEGNVTWCGQYHPDEIAAKLDGSYGLIWDGSNINASEGPLGNYMRYNNPHKCSLYIVAGLPLIVPANSAMAPFVKIHRIGFAVNSLPELINAAVNGEAYYQMRQNVLNLRKKVMTGGYFSEAIHTIEKLYE